MIDPKRVGVTLFQVGDTVRYSLDGAKGIVLKIDENQCHVIWEDYFVSWENFDLLSKIKSGNG
jgi:heat shock protein HspQ